MQTDETEGTTPPGAADSAEAAAAPPAEAAAPPPAETASAPAEATSAPAAEAPAAPAVATSLLSEAVAKLFEANKATHDRLLRVAADFDNFKKRSRKDQHEAVRRAEEKLVIEFLPVLDNLERALAHAEGQQGTLLDGVAMVHKQFVALLEKFDIRAFESMDAAFDPERHEAIQQAHSDRAIGTVCQVMQKGYRRGERLVRPALVVVSLGPAPAEQTTGEPAAAPPAEPCAPEPAPDSADTPKTGES